MFKNIVLIFLKILKYSHLKIGIVKFLANYILGYGIMAQIDFVNNSNNSFIPCNTLALEVWFFSIFFSFSSNKHMLCASLSLVTLNGICHIGPMPTAYILGRHSLLASELIGSGCFCSNNITSHIVSPSVLLPSSRTLHTFIRLK